MRKIAVVLIALLAGFYSFGQEIQGQWDGVLKVQGMQLRIVFNITKTAAGFTATMDSPDQGAKGIPVTTTTFENSRLKLAIPAGNIEYSGELSGNVISGTFKQNGMEIPLGLTRGTTVSQVREKAEDLSNAPFTETPVTLNTTSGQIFGTLTTPKSLSGTPVALIIAGSGPTDRNCNNQMIKCDAYKKLARELAEKGIATVRYDKRGIGESHAALKSEDDIRFDHYVSDAAEWVKLLKKDSRFSRVIVIGHSEGSLIGMVVANGADQYVSIAGAGQSGDRILKIQLSNLPEETRKISDAILESLGNGNQVPITDPKLNTLFRASVQPYLISWFKYDPQKEIAKVRVPVLLIQGTSDIQVTTEDARRLSAACPKAKLILVDNMNHIFRTVDGDRQANLATYNNPALPLADGLVKNISDFILKK